MAARDRGQEMREEERLLEGKQGQKKAEWE